MLGAVMEVSVLGTRGSVPVSGRNYEKYGLATTCVVIRALGQALVIDAGTGILNSAALLDGFRNVPVLLSHPHLDHLLGLACWKPMFDPDRRIEIYARPLNGLSAQQQVGSLFSPPLWPVEMRQLPTKPYFTDIIKPSLDIGAFHIDTAESGHPGGGTLYRIDAGGKSVIYAGDFEHTADAAQRLVKLAHGADLMIYDAQFTPEEYDLRIGWGHSTAQSGVALAQKAKVGRVVFTHHSPYRTDSQLDAMSSRTGFHFVKEGEVFSL